MSEKMGFWSVFAIISGAQIGSGIFMLPTALAPYGPYGIVGWIFSTCGALSLCFAFAALCSRFPHTGGPHVYIHYLFGSTAAFFTGWTYWIISWVSTTVVVIACMGYMSRLLPWQGKISLLIGELILLALITVLNLRGTKITGTVELILTIVKFVPLTLIPLLALWYFNPSHFVLHATHTTSSTAHLLGQVTLLTLWGFVGLEAATTPADSVENPSVTIPKAIIWGTLCTALLYILNYIGITGLVPAHTLMQSTAPYADAAILLFGGNWHLVISLVAAIICIASLNAWIMTSGQIALGLAQDRFMPAFFGTSNAYGAPFWSIIISSIGMVPLLILTANENIATQIIGIIDISVTSFVFVYLVCAAGFAKLLIQARHTFAWYHYTTAFISIVFCVWIISQTPISTLLIASLFTISGIPLYFLWYKKNGSRSSTGMKITMRPFTINDHSRLLSLFFDAVHALPETQYTQEQKNVWAPKSRTSGRWQQTDGRTTIVAEIAGKIVGFADITTSGDIDHLYIDPAHQGKGIGSLLIKKCEELARKNRLPHMTTTASTTAKHVFSKEGFTITAEDTITKDGVTFRRTLMKKILN